MHQIDAPLISQLEMNVNESEYKRMFFCWKWESKALRGEVESDAESDCELDNSKLGSTQQ